MPDDLDEPSGRPVRDARAVVGSDPARGDRRSRRRSAAIALTVAGAVIGGAASACAVAVPTRVSPAPSATGSTTLALPASDVPGPEITPTDAVPEWTPGPTPPGPPIPGAAMMRGADVAPGYLTSDGGSDDHGSIGMMVAYCGRHDYTGAGTHELAYRKRSAGDGTGERYVIQDVTRYEPGWAARHLADLRAVLPRCPTVHVQADPNARSSLTIVRSRFAGDDALLVRDVRSDRGGEVQYLAVVRQGDLESRLRIHIGAGEGQAVQIVRRVGARLCAATPTC